MLPQENIPISWFHTYWPQWGVGIDLKEYSLQYYVHLLQCGDEFDFWLQALDQVGFRLEYLDTEGDGGVYNSSPDGNSRLN